MVTKSDLEKEWQRIGVRRPNNAAAWHDPGEALPVTDDDGNELQPIIKLTKRDAAELARAEAGELFTTRGKRMNTENAQRKTPNV